MLRWTVVAIGVIVAVIFWISRLSWFVLIAARGMRMGDL